MFTKFEISIFKIHLCRRIFIHFFDNQSEHLRPSGKSDTSSSTSQFRNWFQQQYNLFICDLKGHICGSTTDQKNATTNNTEIQMQIVAIRTMLEVISHTLYILYVTLYLRL